MLVWIGAISFESRCNGSIEALLNENIHLHRVIAFDYATNISPRSQGEESRAINRNQFENLVKDKGEIQIVHPYRYAEFIGKLETLSTELENAHSLIHLIVDITCLTKIHTIALAYWLINRRESFPVTLAYSQPEHYGNPSRNIWGKGKWLSTLLVRLDLDSTDPFDSTTLIAILGHEGDRLRLAINEVEANRALVIKVLPLEPMPSRLATVSDIQNAWLFFEIQNGIRQGFTLKTLNLANLDSLMHLVQDVCRNAKKKTSRIVLCPFGPKPFVFASAFSSLSIYSENTWLSYPIPTSYDPEYSSGYKQTTWFSPFI